MSESRDETDPSRYPPHGDPSRPPKWAHAPVVGETACKRCGWVHERCTAHKTSGVPCGQPPMEGGTGVCRRVHGGAPQVVAKAERRVALGRARLELEREGRLGGGEVDTDPAEAMLAMVREAAYNVAVLRDLVAQLDADGTVDGDVTPFPVAAIAGLTGSEKKPNEAQPHVFIAMYDAERERLVKWSKACRDCGVADEVVRLNAQRMDQLATMLRRVDASLLALVLSQVPDELRPLIEERWRSDAPQIIDAAARELDA